MEFDPDAYLAGPSTSGFDPDAYLGAPTSPPKGSEESPALRTASVAGRALVSGAPAAVLGLPALAADAYGSLVNLARRGYNLAAPSIGAEQVPYEPAFSNIRKLGQAGQELAGLLPVEAPRTPGERVLTTGVESALGAITGSGMASAARGLLGGAAAAPAASVGQQLQQRASQAAADYAKTASAAPVLSTVGAGAGGAASQYSAEKGGGAGQNLLAGLAGSFAPAVAGSVASRAITPLTSNLNPEQARLLGVAREQYGLQPSAGQALNIPTLKYMESVASELPGSVGLPGAARRQAESFQSAVMSEANIPGNLATPEVLNAARARAGGEIGQIAKSLPSIPINTPQFSSDITNVVREYLKTPASVQKESFTNWISDIASYGGAMTGQQYQELRRQINDQARRYSKSSSASEKDYGEALRGLTKSLDNAFEQAAGPTKRQDLDQARKDYAMAKTLETAAGGAAGTSGSISGPRLRQVVESQSPTLYRQGYGAFNELSRIGKEFYSPLPQSGTEPRAMARAMMTPGQLSGETLKSAAAAPFGMITSGALLNPAVQAYLRNQLLANRRPSTPAGAPLGAIRGAAQEGLLGQ